MATHGITLTPYYQRIHQPGLDDGFRVRVEASQGVLMSSAIFAYRLLPLQTGQTAPDAVFDHICTSADLADYPLEPIPNSEPPWFRLNFVDVVCRTKEEAEEFWALVSSRVSRLLQSLNREDDLIALAAVHLGATYALSSSSSSLVA